MDPEDRYRSPTSVTPMQVLGAITAEKRIEILAVLSIREMNVTQLANTLGLDEFDMARNLKALLDAGLVDRERRGGAVYQRPSSRATITVSSPHMTIKVDLGADGFVMLEGLALHPLTLRMLAEVASPHGAADGEGEGAIDGIPKEKKKRRRGRR